MLIDKLDDWSALTPEQKKRRLFEQWAMPIAITLDI